MSLSETIRTALEPIANDAVGASMATVRADNAGMADIVFHYLRVLAVGEPITTDELGNALTSDHFNGGLIFADPEERSEAILGGIFQQAYADWNNVFQIKIDSKGMSKARKKILENHKKQTFGPMLNLAHAIQNGTDEQRAQVVEAFRHGKPNKKGEPTDPTNGHLKTVLAEVVTDLILASNIAGTLKDGSPISVGTYRKQLEKVERKRAELAKLTETLGPQAKAMNEAYNEANPFMLQANVIRRLQREALKQQTDAEVAQRSVEVIRSMNATEAQEVLTESATAETITS